MFNMYIYTLSMSTFILKVSILKVVMICVTVMDVIKNEAIWIITQEAIRRKHMHFRLVGADLH